MSAEQIILSAADIRALGGDPDRLEPIATGPATAIRPIALVGKFAGKFALAPAALGAATAEQVRYLGRLPRQQVEDIERKWVADEAAALAQQTTKR